MDRTAWSCTSYRCSVRFRSGELGGQGDTVKTKTIPKLRIIVACIICLKEATAIRGYHCPEQVYLVCNNV